MARRTHRLQTYLSPSWPFDENLRKILEAHCWLFWALWPERGPQKDWFCFRKNLLLFGWERKTFRRSLKNVRYRLSFGTQKCQLRFILGQANHTLLNLKSCNWKTLFLICRYPGLSVYDFLSNYCLYYCPATHHTPLSQIRTQALCQENLQSMCLNSKRARAEGESPAKCSFWCRTVWFWTFSGCNRLL